MKEDQKCKKNDFWGVFLAWPPFVENALFTLLNELKMVNTHIFEGIAIFRMCFEKFGA